MTKDCLYHQLILAIGNGTLEGKSFDVLAGQFLASESGRGVSIIEKKSGKFSDHWNQSEGASYAEGNETGRKALVREDSEITLKGQSGSRGITPSV